jgi:fumarylacetoacetase
MASSWWQTDHTHDPSRTSWVDSANGHPNFPVQNLPFGLFSPRGEDLRIGVAIGNQILDLRECAKAGLLPPPTVLACFEPSLNHIFGLRTAERVKLRRCLSDLLSDPTHRPKVAPFLRSMAESTLQVPARIGDYTDFYVGIHHATNVGKLFRPDTPLLPNYKYVPIGYHGRASSIQASGVTVRRPSGQKKKPEQDVPVFGPTGRLDYELELGIWIGEGNRLGVPIPVAKAANHIAGFCLLNDWSARDFQAWEYQPLGPFLAKNFHSTISPWVVTAEAMAPFRCAQPARPAGDPAPLSYLNDEDDQRHGALSLTLEALLLTPKMRSEKLPPFRLSQGPATNMYWTVNQIVTHHASNGCNLKPGDLLGTGTISAATADGFGSLLELTEGGRRSVMLPKGESRVFLEDGDEVILRAVANAPGFVPIGFGECRAIVDPQ